MSRAHNRDMAATHQLLFFYVKISGNRFIIRSTVGLPMSDSSPLLQDNEDSQEVSLLITVADDIERRESLKDLYAFRIHEARL